MALRVLGTRLVSVVVLLAVLATAARAEPTDEKAVVLEVRVLRISEAAFDKFSGILGIGENGTKTAMLSHRELFLLLAALQADARTNILQAPRLTVLDGAQARLNLGFGIDESSASEKESTWSLSARPSVSSDGKSVRLCLRSDLSAITGGDVKVKKTLRMADGSTAVMGGWKTEVAKSCPAEPSMVSTIPYVCRLFTNPASAPEPGRVLFLVTPRVISGDDTPAPPATLPVKAAPAPSRSR